MSTLSLRPDNRGRLGPTEKWSNSGTGNWRNQHQQDLNVLEPASMNPSFVYTSHSLQSQSMFPQLMRSAEQDSALMQAFAQARMEFLNAQNNINSLDYTLLQSCNSNSMVESSTSDDDCTAPEMHMNCISALGGGPLLPVVATVLDRCGSTSGASLMAHEDFLRMQHTGQTSSGGGPLSPCGISMDSLHGSDGWRSTLTAGLKRRFEAGDEEQLSGRKTQSGQQCDRAHPVLPDRFGSYTESPSSAVGVSPMTSYNTHDPALVMPKASTPLPQKSNASGGSASGVDMDNIHAILFRHASQPVPSLEEIASTRPKRRNVRISKDPQSVAARHRRERISDRMRVLQRLVPGGTKMDTAAMLDEAIHYVKFLKLQLQTLEQIGNGSNKSDAQAAGSFAQPQGVGEAQLGSKFARRPGDLNGGAGFQAWPLNNNNNNTTNNTTRLQAPPQGRHLNQWA